MILFELTATQPFPEERFHGGGEYAKTLFHALLPQASDTSCICACYKPNLWLDPAVREFALQHGVALRPVKGRADLQKLISDPAITRFYTSLPYQYHNIDFSGVELIFTIHGLRPIELPTDTHELWYRTSPKGRAVALGKRALTKTYVKLRKRQFARLLAIRARERLVVVPSLHTKYSLLASFPHLAPAELHVLYSPRVEPGASPSAALCDQVLDEVGVKRRGFFLLMSAGRWLKNALRAVEAIDAIYSDFPEIQHHTVLLGVSRPKRFRRIVDNPERFRFLGYMERQKLECLLATAFVLLYPSLNEGFGYPPLDAMHHGTPVICSGVASLPEVCGDAAVYVDPRSVGEIKNRLLMISLENGLAQTYARRGLERARQVASEQERALRTLCRWILAGREAS